MSFEAENPYRPPAGDNPPPVAPLTYYRVQSTKMSVGEFWRASPGVVVFVLGLLTKLLRITLRIPIGFASFEHLETVAWDDLSPRAREELIDHIDQLKRLGFVAEFCYRMRSVGPVENSAAALRSEDGQVMAAVAYVQTWVNGVSNEKTRWGLVSRTADGRVIATAPMARELDSPPEFDGVVMPGKSIDEVLAAHRERLAAANIDPVRVLDTRALAEQIVAHEQRDFEFQIERGLYVEMTPDEVQQCVHQQQLAANFTVEERPATRLAWLSACGWILIGTVLLMGWLRPVASIGQQFFRLLMLVSGLSLVTGAWIFNWLQRQRD